MDGSWSPDGTKIAFERLKNSNTLDHDIWVMNADGSDPVPMITSTADETHPDWSPDGRKLVFERIVGDYSCDGFLYCGVELFTANVDGSQALRLTDNQTFDNSPSWSPDGTRIVFQRFQRGSCFPETAGQGKCANDIVTIRPDGSDEQVALHNQYANRNPDWSPDGREIAFSSTKDSCCVGEIFKMNADGSALQQLTHYPHPGNWLFSVEPAWSPDGTKIAFRAGYAGSDDEIQTVSADGAGRAAADKHRWGEVRLRLAAARPPARLFGRPRQPGRAVAAQRHVAARRALRRLRSGRRRREPRDHRRDARRARARRP